MKSQIKTFATFWLVNLLFVLCVYVPSANSFVRNDKPKRETDREFGEVTGPVRSVRVERELLESRAGDEFGTGWLPSFTIYNRDGFVEQMTIYNDQGAVDSYSVNEFDQVGNKVRETYYGADNALRYTFLMLYENNHQIEFKNVDVNGSVSGWTKFTYDQTGKRISCTSLNNTGGIEAVTNLSYDETGKLIEEILENQNPQLSHRAVYSYEAEGKSETLRVYNAKGVLDRSYETLIDEKGNKTDLSRNARGKILRQETNEYTRDPHGNWVTELTTEWEDKDNRLILQRKKITRRTITYY